MIPDPFESVIRMKAWNICWMGVECVIPESSILVLYSYPLGTTGPSEEERKLGGWIFEEKSEGGFSRRSLVKAITDRYQEIYEEEERTTTAEAGLIPSMLNRSPTDGKYGIWGHEIQDLVLHTVTYNSENGVYTPGIDSQEK